MLYFSNHFTFSKYSKVLEIFQLLKEESKMFCRNSGKSLSPNSKRWANLSDILIGISTVKLVIKSLQLSVKNWTFDSLVLNSGIYIHTSTQITVVALAIKSLSI